MPIPEPLIRPHKYFSELLNLLPQDLLWDAIHELVRIGPTPTPVPINEIQTFLTSVF